MRRIVLAIPLSVALAIAVQPAPASAITRTEVLARANHWIAKRVRYSQSGTYGGYRRDCSGFVSMAWKLRTSYTSDSIRSKARRISWRQLKPGDAVRRSGHVEIFAGWKNRSRRQYYALEESTWGRPALRSVKRFGRGYTALRLRGIQDAPPVLVASATPPVTTATLVDTAVTLTTASVSASPSVLPTQTAETSATATF